MKLPYPIKHFLATLLIGPCIPVFYETGSSVEGGNPGILQTLRDLIETYPLFLMFGFVFALPAFIIYYLVYRAFIRTTLPSLAIKMLLNTVAIAGLIITLKLIFDSYIPTAIISYSIAVIISSLFFKLRPLRSNEGVEDTS